MEINEDMETRLLTIQGMQFEVPIPFEEGHTCSANEAHALNQTLHENLRNNFASTVQKVKDEAKEAGTEVDTADLQTKLNGYVQGYEFGVRGGGGPSLDPVESLALKLATNVVKDKLKEKGIKLKEFGAEKIRELAEKAVEENPAFKAKAKQIHEIEVSAGDLSA